MKFLIPNKMKKLLIALLVVFGLASKANAQSNWTLNSDKNGIKVYTKNVPDSKIKALKVEGTFDATTA